MLIIAQLYVTMRGGAPQSIEPPRKAAPLDAPTWQDIFLQTNYLLVAVANALLVHVMQLIGVCFGGCSKLEALLEITGSLSACGKRDNLCMSAA